ncbi:reverse transcriptase domain-containing protein [Tanacetum coccineum]
MKKGDFRWSTQLEKLSAAQAALASTSTLVGTRPRGGTTHRSERTDIGGFSHRKTRNQYRPPQSEVKLPEPWILFTDGSSCVDGSGAGLILTNPEGMEFTYALRFEFTATNNEAEYEALLAGLRIAARMGVRNLEANVDSRLVANHVLGEYVAKEDNMVQYLDKTKSLIQGFDRFTIRQVPRGDNKKADALSKIASTSFAHLSKQVLVEILKNKSISEMEISTVIEEQDPTWMTPIVEFISKGTLPHEQKDARRIRRTAQRFELRDGVLYRRGKGSDIVLSLRDLLLVEKARVQDSPYLMWKFRGLSSGIHLRMKQDYQLKAMWIAHVSSVVAEVD